MFSLNEDLDTIENAMTTLHRAGSRHRMWGYITTCAGVSIDRTSAIILYILEQKEKAGCKLTELADKLGTEAPTVTRKIQQLEDSGLISRQTDQKDRRASIIHITSMGRKVVKSIQKAKRQNLKSILEKWPDEDRHQLAKLFHKLANDISEKQYKPVTLKKTKGE